MDKELSKKDYKLFMSAKSKLTKDEADAIDRYYVDQFCDTNKAILSERKRIVRDLPNISWVEGAGNTVVLLDEAIRLVESEQK